MAISVQIPMLKELFPWTAGSARGHLLPVPRFVGRGRRAQNKRSIPLESWRLADFRNVIFLENSPTPFLGNAGFIKFSTFSALLALPVMIREKCGQMAHQTLPNILLSNASLVTKSCIARFVDDDAFNPSALSDCSTGPSPPLAHGKPTLSPFQANTGCPHPGRFGRFRSISEQTAHRSRKIRAQCEGPPIHVLKTHVSCPSVQQKWHIFACIYEYFVVFGLRQATQCQRLYSTPATDAPVLVADRSGRPSSPSPPRPPTPTTTGRGAAVPAPARTVSGNVSYCRQRSCERRKTANFLQLHAKMHHFYSTEGHETRV